MERARALAQKPRRFLLLGFVGVTIILLLVSLGAASYYYSSTSALSAKDQELLHLRAIVLKENLTILQQKLVALGLNLSIASLNQNVLGLENESAFLRLELSVAEQVGKLSVVTYFANQTYSLSPNTTLEITSQANGRNGTLVLLSPGACPITGYNLQSLGTQHLLYILLDLRSKPVNSAYYGLNGQPFSVFLENVGSSQVACRVSLLYVQH